MVKKTKKSVRILTDISVIRTTTQLDRLVNLDSKDESDDCDYAVLSDQFWVRWFLLMPTIVGRSWR